MGLNWIVGANLVRQLTEYCYRNPLKLKYKAMIFQNGCIMKETYWNILAFLMIVLTFVLHQTSFS